jgi:hypothetical protein
MISHVVLFKPEDSFTDARRGILIDAVTNAVTRCPTVRACRVGRRTLHGLPGYEQAMREDYEYALVLEFDDLQGLRDYLTHPEHTRLAELFVSGSASLAYDYEMVDLRDAHTLSSR